MPSDIAYLSFTNKAVNEAKHRAEKQFKKLTDEDLKNLEPYIVFVDKTLKQNLS